MPNTNKNANTRCITKNCFSTAPQMPASRSTHYFAFLPVTLLLLTSCTTANWYHSVKASGENECRKLPAREYEECLRSYDQSYQEYQKQREEAIQK